MPERLEPRREEANVKRAMGRSKVKPDIVAEFQMFVELADFAARSSVLSGQSEGTDVYSVSR